MSLTPVQCNSSPVWIGRQPIVNSQKDLLGFEVLYRSGEANRAAFTDGTQATSSVLLSLFIDIGLDEVADKGLVFVNMTREFLVGEYALPECPDRLVVEVLEDIPIDDEVIAGVRKLKEAGYKIALDDVVFHADLRPLLNLADFVKVDLPEIPRSKWGKHAETFRRWPVKLLAEKVETHEEYEYCCQLGFDFFQGHFLSKPELIEGRSLDGNQVALMRILAEINAPETDIQKLALSVEQDAALCVKLLKYVNSSFVGVRQNIETLQHACTLIGLERLRTITTLLLLAGRRDVPQHAARAALLRATMCRSLSNSYKDLNPHALFTTGLLSALDVLMGQPLEELLEQLPIEDHIRDAALNRSGSLGQVLQDAIDYEHCLWEQLMERNANTDSLAEAYLDAMAQVKAIWESAG